MAKYIVGMKMQFSSFKTQEELTNELANAIHGILLESIHQCDKAFMVVSGGKTPIELFKTLSLKELPWNQVVITLADERCVDAQSPECNEHLVRRYLLQNKARNACFMSLYNTNLEITENIKQLEQSLSEIPAFDVVILGMGIDGHTASLFPCSKEFQEGLVNEKKSVLVVNPKTAPYQRISLTKKRLLTSKHVFLHLVGEKKKQVLEESMLINDPLERPIVAFLNEKTANIKIMYAPEIGEMVCIQ
jgi:6-phosphogluconolactonase